MQVIIYKQDGKIVTVFPTPEAVAQIGINTIAQKDVPVGVPYKLIDYADVPTREDRESWDIPDAEFTDGAGGAFGAGTDDAPVEYVVDQEVVVTRNSSTGELKAYDLSEKQFIDLTETQNVE